MNEELEKLLRLAFAKHYSEDVGLAYAQVLDYVTGVNKAGLMEAAGVEQQQEKKGE